MLRHLRADTRHLNAAKFKPDTETEIMVGVFLHVSI